MWVGFELSGLRGPGGLAQGQEATALFSEPAVETQPAMAFPNANAFYQLCCPSDRKALL